MPTVVVEPPRASAGYIRATATRPSRAIERIRTAQCRYIYAGDDPINYTDPSGACVLCTKHVKRTVRSVTRAAHGSLDFLASDRGWNGLRVAADAAACAEGAEIGAVAGPEGAVIGCLAVAIAFDASAEQARRRISEAGG